MHRLRTFIPNILSPRDWPTVSENTFILWEPCSSSHGEIVPGYTKYLLDLGFHVLVLMTPDRIDEGLFSRFPDANFDLARLPQKQIRRFVRSREAQAAKGILVTTAGKLPKRTDATPDLDQVFGSFPKDRIHLVEHNASNRLQASTWDEDLITLRQLVPPSPSKLVNPMYFGETGEGKTKAGHTTFLMVGAARAKRRSDDLLLDAVETLLKDGISNFEIRMIGKPGKTALPEHLTPYVKSLGRLSFDAMYDEVEAADFILTAFQKNNQDHAFYRTVGTSGSFQLAYGFSTPIVLQKRFAEGTAFAENNSFLYDEDADFSSTLKLAISLPKRDYDVLVQQLRRDASALYETSKSNLKDLIHGH